MAMTEPHLVDFEIGKDGYKLITICHGFKSILFQMWSEFHSSVGIYLYQH